MDARPAGISSGEFSSRMEKCRNPKRAGALALFCGCAEIGNRGQISPKYDCCQHADAWLPSDYKLTLRVAFRTGAIAA
jgi:hypothetical protein